MFLSFCTVKEVEIARLTLNPYNFSHTQPSFLCNTALEPHYNSELFSFLKFENPCRNNGVISGKLKEIWKLKVRVFCAWSMPIYCSKNNFSDLFDIKNTFLCTSNDITYLPTHLAAYLSQKIWKIRIKLNFGDFQSL